MKRSEYVKPNQLDGEFLRNLCDNIIRDVSAMESHIKYQVGVSNSTYIRTSSLLRKASILREVLEVPVVLTRIPK